MDSDKLLIPDKWIHQFVLRTREYLFSDDVVFGRDRVPRDAADRELRAAEDVVESRSPD